MVDVKGVIEKVREMGGELAGPASVEDIAALEIRLEVSLPDELRNFLKLHNGSERDTDLWMWRFWPCEEIRIEKVRWVLRNEEDLAGLGASQEPVSLSNGSFLYFADALVEAAIYAVYIEPGHLCHGMVMDPINREISAANLTEWGEKFVRNAGEDVFLNGSQ